MTDERYRSWSGLIHQCALDSRELCFPGRFLHDFFSQRETYSNRVFLEWIRQRGLGEVFVPHSYLKHSQNLE
jgi:hypothetical protein